MDRSSPKQQPLPPRLLFLPGHMCDERAWQPVAEQLSAVGYKFDHSHLGRDDNIDAMAHHVLGSDDGRFIAVGFSMGAIAALALHRAAPERVAGLCLVGINASADLPERSEGRVRQQDLVRRGGLRDVVSRELVPLYFSERSSHREGLVDVCIDMAESVGAENFVRQSEALRLRPDARAGLRAIACPTLVIGGAEDRLCPPAWHRETAEAISGAVLSIIENAGHMALLEQSAEMAQIILRWLEANWQPVARSSNGPEVEAGRARACRRYLGQDAFANYR